MFVDKRAVAAIVVLVILVVSLVGGLFVFLNQAELPELNIAGLVEDVRETISGIFSGAEEETTEISEPPLVLVEQNEIEDVIELVETWFSGELLLSVEENASTTAARDGVVYFVSVPDDVSGRIDIGQFGIGGDPLSFQSMDWDPDRTMQVFALSVTEALEYRMFLTDITPEGTERRFFYVQYDGAGELLFQHELPADLFESLDNLSSVAVAFTEAGELVVQGIDGCDTRIAVMDADGTFRGEFDPGCGRIGRARDGRIVFADDHEESLWELDLEAVAFGAQLAESGVTGVVQSTMLLEGEFDLYFNRTIDDIRYLYGYMIETGLWTRLFAWEDVGSAADGTLFPLISLPDGSIVVRERFHDRDRTDFILLVPETD